MVAATYTRILVCADRGRNVPRHGHEQSVPCLVWRMTMPETWILFAVSVAAIVVGKVVRRWARRRIARRAAENVPLYVCKLCRQQCHSFQVFCGAGCSARWEAGERMFYDGIVRPAAIVERRNTFFDCLRCGKPTPCPCPEAKP